MAAEEEVLGKAYDSRLMKRLLGYLRPYTVQVIVALTAIVLKAAADVAGPLLTMFAIDIYLAPFGSAHHGDAVSQKLLTQLHNWFARTFSSDPLTGIGQICAIYAGLLLFSFILEFLQTYFMQWTGQKVMFDLRSQIFRHLQRMHVAFFDKNPVGRLVTRTTTDVDALNEMFTSGVVAIFEDVFVLSFIIVIMLAVDWRLALITFGVLPLIVWATTIFRRSVRDSYRGTRTAIARINSYLQEHVTGMMVLQLFNRERKAYKRFVDINNENMLAWKDAILAYAIYYPVVEVLSSIAIACVIYFGGRQVLAHAMTGITIGTIAAFISYAQRFFRPIQDLSDKYNILQSAMASGERIFKLLDTPAEIVSPAEPTKVEGPGRIEFDHVWFAYRELPKEDEQRNRGRSPSTGVAEPELDWVLRDVSFTVEPGENIAIVGHTGAGKTTIISLLMRFYDVQKGAIKIDGVDIKQMDLLDLRRRISVVLQDPFLFTGTIAQNIRLGSSWITDEMMERAAEDVNVADFIASLPNGFDEPVVERGSTLSTGQKQLISFARALAHNPKILILDEATSSVDTETEMRVREALTKLVEGRTSLVIAHRLSTIQRADKIIVMHKGRVREMGSHQQLLANRGIYYKLYQLQYKDQELPGAPTTTPQVTVSGDD
ncbi:MAG TPA: ABC transporter ATP-binding protein [Terriglobales bacterium]|nr:ABC transporter ATP-binding protein [Terriglobales bacterium]